MEQGATWSSQPQGNQRPVEAVCCWFSVSDDPGREEFFWKEYHSREDTGLIVRKLRRARGFVMIGLVGVGNDGDGSLKKRDASVETLFSGFPEWCQWHFYKRDESLETFLEQATEQLRCLLLESRKDDDLLFVEGEQGDPVSIDVDRRSKKRKLK